jgi:NitT/TauT family transport system permease protein
MVGFWELLVRGGVLNGEIISAPSLIAARALDLFSSVQNYILFQHIWCSLYRALGAFVLAVILAVPLGFWLGLSQKAYHWLSPVLSLFLPLPAVAWTPIFLVILGHGVITIVLVCFLGAVFPVLYSTIQGVQSIPQHSIWVLRSMGANPGEVFFKVLVPASLPTLLAGFKLGLAHSWRTLVAAEMLAALSSGLGFMIFAARQYLDVHTMLVGIVILAAMGFMFEHLLLGGVEQVTVRRWYGSRRERA